MTGNLCRRVFSAEEIFSQITGVPLDLVHDFNRLLAALNSNQYIIADDFEELCNSWLDRFHASGISWNQLSPTVHDMFYHAPQIIRVLDLPPSYYSEEPSENCHRYIRNIELTKYFQLNCTVSCFTVWKLRRFKYINFSSKVIYC